MYLKKKTKSGSWLLKALFVIFAAAACFSLYMIVSTLRTGAKEQDAFRELTALVELEKEKAAAPGTGQGNPGSPTVPEKADMGMDTEPGILPEYAAVYAQNSDFYGWICIEDTVVDYPVMHTPEIPEYYLYRAFDKGDAQSGTLFLDGACYKGCGNAIIYGHNMNNGTMFAALPKYAEKGFWETHQTIYFDTLYERGEYQVVAAFYGRVIGEGEQGFPYYQYTDLTDPAVFKEFMAKVRAAAIYDTGITAEYGDELITLSTCSYHTDDGRFAVIAKKNAPQSPAREPEHEQA